MSIAQNELPNPSQGRVICELFTTIDKNGKRIVRSRQIPVTTTDPDFSRMMEVPERRPRIRINPVGHRLFPVMNNMGGFMLQPEIGAMNFGLAAMNNEQEITGANGPGNTRPQLGDPMENRVEAFNRVIDAVMSIYPELGEGTNAQNVTQEQSDIIKGILGEANFPVSRRMRNLVLREVILRTTVKTPLSETELAQLETKKFSDLTATQKEDAKCAICMTEYSDSESVRIMQCKHFFHQECIDPYLAKYNNKCPICREHLASDYTEGLDDTVYTDADLGIIEE